MKIRFKIFVFPLLKILSCLLQAFIENTFCQNIVESLCILIIALYPNQTCKSKLLLGFFVITGRSLRSLELIQTHIRFYAFASTMLTIFTDFKVPFFLLILKELSHSFSHA